MTTPEEIDSIIQTPHEGQHLEFKEAKAQFDFTKLLKYCVALSNEGGGLLLLGITDKTPRKVVGSAAFPDTGRGSKQIFDKLKFRVDVEDIEHADGRVVVFHIPPREAGVPRELDGVAWMRVDESLERMTAEQRRAIYLEGQPGFLDLHAKTGLGAEDVVNLLDTQGYFELFELPYPENRTGVLERLSKERLISEEADGWAITNLAAVLFAKSLNEFGTVAGKAPRVVKYDGVSKTQTILVNQTGDKGYAVAFEGLVSFINGLLPANEVVGDAIRKEVRVYPAIAVRELVANALVHQDFALTGTAVTIEVYSNRIEISNPGVPLTDTERFIDEYRTRNETLAGLMRRIGICEALGSGIDKVIEAVELYQLPAPEFLHGQLRTTAVLHAPIPFADMAKEDRIRACYQHCVLKYILRDKMTNQSLRERFELPPAKTAVVTTVIAATTEAGVIKQDSSGTSSRRYVKYVPSWA